MNRRQLLYCSSAATLLAGCKPEEILEDIKDWKIPKLDDLELGEIQFGWDGEGNLYEIRSSDHTVTRIGKEGKEEWAIGGADQLEAGGMNYPVGIGATRAGMVAVVEAGGGRVSFYSTDGTLLRQAGELGTEEGQLLGASDAVSDGDDKLYIVDKLLHRVLVYDKNGSYLSSFGTAGAEAGQLNGPCALALDKSNRLHIVDKGNARIQVFSTEGQFLSVYGTDSGQKKLVAPRTISIDPLGNIWVADPIGGAVHVYNSDGIHQLRFANLVLDGVEIQPLRAAITPDGAIYLQVNLIQPEG